MNRIIAPSGLSLIVWFMLALLAPSAAGAAPPAQSAADWAIPNGRFFTQAGSGQGGFSVVDDGEARFWSEFQRLGGAETVGYPISRRTVRDGFVTQAFQKLVLQWRPEVGQAWPVNVFDELSRAGFDDTLWHMRQTPNPVRNFDPPGASWEQIILYRQALLDPRPALRSRYFAAADPLSVFGLPVSAAEDMGNHYAIRTQRAVLQEWKEDVPWARTGQVTVANGGDIGKELGWLAGPAIDPEPLPADGTGAFWETTHLLVGPQTQGPLWALQRRGGDARLFISGSGGERWEPFAGGLPTRASCLTDLALDYTTPNRLYASSCEGLFQWDGGQWVKRSPELMAAVTVEYPDPAALWGITSGDNAMVVRSSDGGATWRPGGLALPGPRATTGGAIDIAALDQLYVLWGSQGASYTLHRSKGDGLWDQMALPTSGSPTLFGLTVDGRSGDLYLSARPRLDPMNNGYGIWRSSNPTITDGRQVRWESYRDSFAPNYTVNLLGSGYLSEQFTLFIEAQPEGFSPQLFRSSTGGPWTPVPLPRD